MSDYNLGTARGRIEVDASGAVKGAAEADAAIGKVGSRSPQAQAAMLKIGAAGTAAGAAVVAGFGYAINKASEFEATISGIGAVTGAGAEDLDALRKKALQLGKDTVFSADESAQAMEELAKAGIPVEGILNGAADAAVALAAAGGISIPEAATLASDAMNTFNLRAQDMKGVADIFAQAANASSIDMGQLKMALGQVGAVAHLTGLDVRDTSIAIAEMGQAGIKGSDAGTSLKTMLMNLVPHTDKAKGLMQDLGIITKDGANQFFDASGKVKSLAQIQDVLSKSLSGMSKEQKLAALNTLFGSDAIRAASVLADNGAKGYGKMSDAMNDQGSAADIAKKRMDNFKGSMEQFKGSLETLAIVIGETLLPIARKFIDALTWVLNKFLSLPGPVKVILIILVALVGAIVGISGAVLTVIALFGMWTAATAALEISLLPIIGTVALVVAAIAAIIAIIVLVVKYHDQLWNAIKKVWNAIVGAIKTAVMGVINFVRDHWKTILTILTGPLGWFVAFVIRHWSQIKSIFGNAISWIKSTVVNGFISLYNGAIGWMNRLLGWITRLPGMMLRALGNLGGILWDAGRQILNGLWNGMKSMFGTVKDGLGGLAKSLVSWKGPPSYDAKLLTGNGELIMQSLMDGIEAQLPTLKTLLGDVTYTIQGQTVPAVGSPTAATGGGTMIGGDTHRSIEVNIYNPVAEKSSASTARTLRTQAALGVI